MTTATRIWAHSCALAAVVLIAGVGAGCRNVQLGSWSAREDVLLEDGICSVFQKGMLYSEFWHNAPRQQVYDSMAATIRFSRSGDGIEVVAVESCPAPDLEVEYLPGPDQAVHIAGARGTWRIREQGSASRPLFEVTSADGSVERFPAGSLLDSGTALPAFAPAADTFYVVVDRVDSRTVGVGRLASGYLSVVRIPHDRLFGLAVGERVHISTADDTARR